MLSERRCPGNETTASVVFLPQSSLAPITNRPLDPPLELDRDGVEETDHEQTSESKSKLRALALQCSESGQL